MNKLIDMDNRDVFICIRHGKYNIAGGYYSLMQSLLYNIKDRENIILYNTYADKIGEKCGVHEVKRIDKLKEKVKSFGDTQKILIISMCDRNRELHEYREQIKNSNISFVIPVCSLDWIDTTNTTVYKLKVVDEHVRLEKLDSNEDKAIDISQLEYDWEELMEEHRTLSNLGSYI